MTKERLKVLIKRYHEEQCTTEELQELDAYYSSLDKEAYESLPGDVTFNWEHFAGQEYERLQQALATKQPHTQKTWMQPYKIAAVVIGLIGIGLLSLYLWQSNYSHVSSPSATVLYNVKGSTSADSRYLLLPDSSIIILHTGSSLKIDSTQFNKTNREVVLTGEAFFDVKHQAGKPFIVHAGKTKITVLGTAFNIKASGSKVAVTVARGKVKVEEGNRTSILAPNQQVVYNANEVTVPVTKAAIADEEASWIKAGLSFNNERLDSIANTLQIRYNVSIVLGTRHIAQCRVSAGSPFIGTESVEEILSLICPAVNATFRKQGSTIIIEGPGCDIN